MTRRIFEFNCSCSVYRDNIEVEVKGYKGKLKRIVLTEFINSYTAKM